MTEKKYNKKPGFSIGFSLTLALVAIILLASLSGMFMSLQSILSLNKKIAEAKEAARPADIDIIVIQASSCQDCFNLSTLIDVIKKENVNVNSEKTVEITSSEGLELISKYNITKAPSLIISGEIEKDATLKAMWEQLGEIKDDIFVLTQVGAPYVLTDSGEVRGRIKWVMLTDTSCNECYDVARHEQILGSFGIPIQDQQVVSSQLSDGKELIAKYKINLLPTIILTGDLEAYPSLIKIWSEVGTIEEDKAYVFREGVKQMGIYKDLTTNKVINPRDNQSGS